MLLPFRDLSLLGNANRVLARLPLPNTRRLLVFAAFLSLAPSAPHPLYPALPANLPGSEAQQGHGTRKITAPLSRHPAGLPAVVDWRWRGSAVWARRFGLRACLDELPSQ